jgi:hypothetical protein
VLRFTDRMIVTLASLRLGTPHEALAAAFGPLLASGRI